MDVNVPHVYLVLTGAQKKASDSLESESDGCEPADRARNGTCVSYKSSQSS